MRWIPLATAITALLLAGSRDVRAKGGSGPPPPPGPMHLLQAGPKTIRVRVAAGNVQPCDSGSNRILYDDTLKPNATLDFMVSAGCICVEQTYDDFPDTDWSQSHLECRPQKCEGSPPVCYPDATGLIDVTVYSSRP